VRTSEVEAELAPLNVEYRNV